VTTDEGIDIDKSTEQPKNAFSPIRDSFDGVSKVTAASL
jgi:hypothetical protein